jgi:hypothetical protein
MSIDMSSVIPLIHANDIKIITKDEDAKRARPIEESYESDETGLQMGKEELKEKIVRDNLRGVGDTYSTKGELVRESRPRLRNEKSIATIDMVI